MTDDGLTASTLLIANRGEIAARIARSARALGIHTVVAVTPEERDAPFADRRRGGADASVELRAAPGLLPYLDERAVVDAARRAGATAVHPGYGFLAESHRLARAVLDAGLVWVGPAPDTIAAMADKAEAKARMRAAGVPCLPDSPIVDDDLLHDPDALRDAADAVGWPLLVKAVAGGGGRGMRPVDRFEDLADAVEAARAESLRAFGDPRVILERRLDGARHVEVQILADRDGHTIHLGTRDCSVQRRHQKLVEEAPAPFLSPELRRRCEDLAVRGSSALGYVNAGTVELLVRPDLQGQGDDSRDGQVYFLEMNTRLQVEHPVTEAITGLDLVAWQLRIAHGEPLTLRQDEVRFDGHAIEARLCLEDPAADFAPRSGRVVGWRPPPSGSSENGSIRVDHALRDDLEISPRYDSMVAKIVSHVPGTSRNAREDARRRLADALRDTVLLGPPTNRAFLLDALESDDFTRGELDIDLGRRLAAVHRPPPLEPPARAAAAFLLACAWGEPSSTDPSLWGWRSSPGGAGWPVELEAVDVDAEIVSLWLEPLPSSVGAANDDGSIALRVTERSSDDPSSERSPIVHCRLDGPNRLSVVDGDGLEHRYAWSPGHAAPPPPGAAYATVHLAELGTAATWHLRDAVHRPSSVDDAEDPETDAALLVRAPMAGTLRRVESQQGDRVEPGDVLCIVEAMKLQHRVEARVAGTITEILVTTGDQVAHRQVLMRLEPRP